MKRLFFGIELLVAITDKNIAQFTEEKFCFLTQNNRTIFFQKSIDM